MDKLNLNMVDSGIEESTHLESNLKTYQNMLRLSNVQAKVGIEQLKTFDVVNQKRRENAEMLLDQLSEIKGVKMPQARKDSKSSFLYFRIQVPDESYFRKKLLLKGVDSKRDDMTACSTLESLGEYKMMCPEAERAALHSIEIPNNPKLKKEDVVYIARQINQVAEQFATIS